VPELLSRFASDRELHEFLAYNAIEPRGARRDDLRAGHQTALLIDTLRATAPRARRARPTRISDVTVDFWRTATEDDDSEESDLTPEEGEALIAAEKAHALATGGRIIEKGVDVTPESNARLEVSGDG
jgi:hypothetical protein